MIGHQTTLRSAARVSFPETRPHAPLGLPPMSGLDLDQLLVLFAAYQAADEVFTGIFNQPRGERIADLLKAEAERCTMGCQLVAEQAGMRAPTSDHERQVKGEILLRWAFMCGDGRDEIALIAREHFTSREAVS